MTKYVFYVDEDNGEVSDLWYGTENHTPPSRTGLQIVEVDEQTWQRIRGQLKHEGTVRSRWAWVDDELVEVQDPRPIVRFSPSSINTAVHPEDVAMVTAELVDDEGERVVETRTVLVDVPWGGNIVPIALEFVDGLATLEVGRARPMNSIVGSCDGARIPEPLVIRIAGVRLG